MMAGTYVAYVVTVSAHLAFEWAVIAGIVVGAALGLLCERTAIWPLEWRKRSAAGGAKGGQYIELITTVGFAAALGGLAEVVWGVNPVAVRAPGTFTTLHLFGGVILAWQLVLIILGVAAPVGIHLWLRHTRVGLACAAMSEDHVAAITRGINAKKLSKGSFIAAGALAGLAGVIMAPTTYAYASLADSLALTGFVALALGGMGSQIGCLLGGLLVGEVSSFGTRYVSTSYSDVFVFAVLILTLYIRPTGILGKTAARRV